MTDKTMREIAKGIAEAFDMPLPTDGEIYYLLKERTDAILALPEIKEGQDLLEKAKSGKDWWAIHDIVVEEVSNAKWTIGECAARCANLILGRPASGGSR